jgi:hypothetical protein
LDSTTRSHTSASNESSALVNKGGYVLRTPGRLPLPVVADAGLHHVAEGWAGAARAVAESHSTGSLAPALWELEEVVGELARYACDAA